MAALEGEYGVNPAKLKKDTKDPVKMRCRAGGRDGGDSLDSAEGRSQRLRMA